MSIRTGLLAACLSLAAAPAAVQAQGAAEAIFQRAVADFERGQIDAAADGFDQVAELLPQQAPHLWQRGMALLRERFADCIEQFESHRTVNPRRREPRWHYIAWRAPNRRGGGGALLPVGPIRACRCARSTRCSAATRAGRVMAAGRDSPRARFYAPVPGAVLRAQGRPAKAFGNRAGADGRYARAGGYMHMVAESNLASCSAEAGHAAPGAGQAPPSAPCWPVSLPPSRAASSRSIPGRPGKSRTILPPPCRRSDTRPATAAGRVTVRDLRIAEPATHRRAASTEPPFARAAECRLHPERACMKVRPRTRARRVDPLDDETFTSSPLRKTRPSPMANEMRRDNFAIVRTTPRPELRHFFIAHVTSQVNAIVGDRRTITPESQVNTDRNPTLGARTGGSRRMGGRRPSRLKSLRYGPGRRHTRACRCPPRAGGTGLVLTRFGALLRRAATLSIAGAGADRAGRAAGLPKHEIRPTIADLTSDLSATPPFTNASRTGGIDRSRGLTQEPTADGTVKPDFRDRWRRRAAGQPSTRFSLFFPGERGVLLENRGLFASAAPGRSVRGSDTRRSCSTAQDRPDERSGALREYRSTRRPLDRPRQEVQRRRRENIRPRRAGGGARPTEFFGHPLKRRRVAAQQHRVMPPGVPLQTRGPGSNET